MDQEKTIKEKILSYFNGNLSSSGEAELLKWINQDTKNLDFFFNLKNELDPEEIRHEQLAESYAELRNRLFINSQFRQSKPRKTRKLYIQISRIAALLFVVVALSFSLAWLMTNQHQKEVVWFETNAPRGEKSQLLLPDGSKVWLNSESTLSFPSNFVDRNREVKLEGEAYFEVKKLHGLPFTVKTQAYDVHVLGTKFNVMAYKDFNRTETSLIEGHVQVQKGEQIVDLEPGQMLTYKDNKLEVQQTNTVRSSFWKDDKFNFDHVTFKELVLRLERWYNVDIKLNSEELNDIVYSGVFKNEETIWQVLNSIEMTLPIKYHRSGFREFVIEHK